MFTAQRSRVIYTGGGEELARGLSALERDGGWAVFTSPNGVECFFRALAELKFDVRRLAGTKFAVVGARTGAALESRGIYPEITAEPQTTAALAAALESRCAGETALLLRGDAHGREPEETLTRAGARVMSACLYRVETEPVEDGRADYVIFGSAGGVRRYFEAGGESPDRAFVCVGEPTSRAVPEGHRVLIAREPSPEAIVECMIADWRAGA